MATGRWEVISMAMIWSELAVESPFVVNSLHFFQMTVWEKDMKGILGVYVEI